MSSKIRGEKEQSSSMIISLPDDVILDILARVPKCNYRVHSLVSELFQSLVSSPDLYARRSFLGCTEACIYAILYNVETKENRLYVLRRKDNISTFVLVPSIPPLRLNASLVAVVSRIYIASGIYVEDMMRSLTINCRSHTVQPLPSLPFPMIGMVADIIDGKIYLIGTSYSGISVSGPSLSKTVMVFDIKTQMWERGMIKLGREVGYMRECVVMANKLYMNDYEENSFVYRPKENKWKPEEMLNAKTWNNVCAMFVEMLFQGVVNELSSPIALKHFDLGVELIFNHVLKGDKD